MIRQIVRPGKIVTILFNSPFSRPLKITINDGKKKKNQAVYISPAAPLAKAIIHHQTGEEIEFMAPEGKLKVKIVRIDTN